MKDKGLGLLKLEKISGVGFPAPVPAPQWEKTHYQAIFNGALHKKIP